MPANVTDLTRVTGTIACDGVATTNPITNAVLRTALGYNDIGLCTIGGSDGYYTMFGFRVDTTGGRTWDFAVDDIGDGTYTSLKTGLASGTNVTIGIIPGAFSDGTVVGARRPFSFQVTLSSADANSVISFSAMRVLPNDARMIAADLTSTNTAIAAISSLIGAPNNGTLGGDTTAIIGSLSLNAYGTAGEALDVIYYLHHAIIIETGTLDGVFTHTTTVVECSTLDGSVDYYGTGCRALFRSSADGRRTVRSISSYDTANKRLTLGAALPWTPVNGDTFVVIPA